jgi:hypothetical protein
VARRLRSHRAPQAACLADGEGDVDDVGRLDDGHGTLVDGELPRSSGGVPPGLEG